MLAEFLLATLSHQKLEWEELPSILGWTEIDSEVCSFLKTRDRTFDAERQLKILDNEKKLSEWQFEYEKREMNDDGNTLAANNPEPVFRRRYPLAVSVDVSGLLPPLLPPSYNILFGPHLVNTANRPQSEDTPDRPPSTDSSPRTLSPDPVERVESPSEPAEEIARRIENMSVTGKPGKTEKLSKAKVRDLRRKKAKERAKEGGEAKDAPRDDVGEGGSREQV